VLFHFQSITEKEEENEAAFFTDNETIGDEVGADDDLDNLSVSFIDGYDTNNTESPSLHFEGSGSKLLSSQLRIRESTLLPLNVERSSIGKGGPHAQQQRTLKSLLIPKMTILVMAVGTR
jgi:hypothetical protein